jgi:hypothetical protein
MNPRSAISIPAQGRSDLAWRYRVPSARRRKSERTAPKAENRTIRRNFICRIDPDFRARPAWSRVTIHPPQVIMSPIRFVSFAFLLTLAVFFFSSAQSAPV